jgi:hypothetical protein
MLRERRRRAASHVGSREWKFATRISPSLYRWRSVGSVGTVVDTPKKRRRGRPALSAEARRSALVAVRFTPEQAAKIEVRAAEADLSVASYVFQLVADTPRPAPSQAAFAHAAEVTRLATRLARIERLADAGRPIAVPVGELRRLADALHEAGMLALGLQAGECSCSRSSSKGARSAASFNTSSNQQTTRARTVRRSPC